ncbi:hypothetical protein AB8S33_26275, partial [Klebsiella pneumoniae subsp. ozaenae]
FAGKKSAQIREILISESAWEEMTCLFAPSLGDIHICFYYKEGVNERMTYEVFLPIYEYNEFRMSATKGFKFYRNNNEMLYKQPFEFYVKPNLKLDGLHGFINKDFPIGSGLSSV